MKITPKQILTLVLAVVAAVLASLATKEVRKRIGSGGSPSTQVEPTPPPPSTGR